MFRFIALVLCSALVSATPPQTITEADYQRLVDVSSPAVAPDGKHAVVLVRRTLWNDDKRAIDLVEEPNGQVTVDAFVRASVGSKILSLIQSDDRNELRLLCQLEKDGDMTIEASVLPETAAAIRALPPFAA